MSIRFVLFLAAVLLPMGWVPVWQGQAQTTMKLESSAFAQGQPIPRQYTCEGADVSLPLHWSDPPQGTKSFALIFDDPDTPVGDWVHWVIYNIPAATRSLPEGVPKTESAAGGLQGRSSFNEIGYGGPCPAVRRPCDDPLHFGFNKLDHGGPCPPSGLHRLFFRLYALDNQLSLPSDSAKKKVEAAMRGHIVAKAELMGTYERGK